MSPGIKSFFKRWIINTFAVLAADFLVSGISANSTMSLIFAALVLGVLNAILRPILLILSLPFLIITLGFFFLIINALLLSFVGFLVPGFHVDGFGAAFLGGLVISIMSMLLNTVTTTKVDPPKNNSPRGPDGPPSGGGPIIDV